MVYNPTPPTFGTTMATQPLIPLPEENLKKTEKQRCEAKGGRWDEGTKTCILIKKDEVTETTPPKVDSKGIETWTSSETGRPSGVTMGGKTYFGLNASDIQLMQQQKEAEEAKLAGTAPVGTAQAQADEQFRIQQSMGQIGTIGQLMEAEQANINWGQALTAGGVRVLPGLAGGAATGAVVGGVAGAGVGAPLGAAVGAAAGAVTGFVSGILGNIKAQQSGELKAADIELKNARTNMRQLAMLASQDPANSDIYIQQYNAQLTRVYQARRQTKAEVQGNLNAFMEDGREQLADFDAFLQPGGIADIYGQKLQIALGSGTPLSIYGEELL